MPESGEVISLLEQTNKSVKRLTLLVKLLSLLVTIGTLILGFMSFHCAGSGK